MTSRFILILTLGLALSAPVHADIAAAYYALNHGDFKAAVKEFSRLADTGDARAQSYLGYMYYVGQGVKQDYGQAVRWFRKAAKQGDRDAEYNLAVAYAFGKGVDKDLKTAAQWYRKAAEQGHAAAQYSLGLSYARGDGVKQDREQALHWFRKAADQGYADAKKAVQSMSENADKNSSGDADDKHSEARAETKTAESTQPAARAPLPGAETPAKTPLAKQSPEDGKKGPAIAKQAGTGKQPAGRGKVLEGNGKPITRAEIAQDVTPDFKSLDNTTTGGGLPDHDALPAAGTGTGTATGSGEGTGHFLNRLFGSHGTDTHQATKTGETAGDKGSGKETTPARPPDKAAHALYQKGMAALSKENFRDAALAFHEAALKGDPRSQFQLGSLFYQGLGVTRDYSEAQHWYQMAAENGNADAQYSLGNMYFMGRGVKQNDRKAAYWYKKAAAQGNDSARHNLENLKRLISLAGEKPRVAKGKVPQGDAKAAQQTSDHKRGFFSRLFGRDKTRTEELKPSRSFASADKAFSGNKGHGLFGPAGNNDS
jgi:TPR repeat protein